MRCKEKKRFHASFWRYPSESFGLGRDTKHLYSDIVDQSACISHLYRLINCPLGVVGLANDVSINKKYRSLLFLEPQARLSRDPFLASLSVHVQFCRCQTVTDYMILCQNNNVVAQRCQKAHFPTLGYDHVWFLLPHLSKFSLSIVISKYKNFPNVWFGHGLE